MTRARLRAISWRALQARLSGRAFPDRALRRPPAGDLASKLLEPGADRADVARKLRQADPLYYATYYAIDTINYQPASWASAPTTIDAAYLPVVIQQAAGLPLDPTFAEQRRIMQRCGGVFYACNGGIEARRFNRALMDAGLIKGL